MTTQMTPQQLQAQNLAERQVLLATAERMNQNIGVQNAMLPYNGGAAAASLNGTPLLRQKLFNVGVITSLDITVTMSLNITAAAVLSPKAPWNLLSFIGTRDFSQELRVNSTGFLVWLLNTVRYRKPHGLTMRTDSFYPNGGFNWPFPKLPTAIGNNQTLQFKMRVPVCYDPERDTTGAILAQALTGELYLELGLNPQVFGTDVDSVFMSGAGTINSVSVKTVQNYLAPAATPGASGGAPQIILPALDLSTVYEINGSMRTNADLSANIERLITVPNTRTIMSVFLNYINGGLMNPGTDISEMRLLIGGSLPLKTWTPDDLAFYTREDLSFDLPPSVYYFSSRAKPIDTIQYGNTQYGIKPTSVLGGNTYLEAQFESFYTAGANTTGMVQG